MPPRRSFFNSPSFTEEPKLTLARFLKSCINPYSVSYVDLCKLFFFSNLFLFGSFFSPFYRYFADVLKFVVLLLPQLDLWASQPLYSAFISRATGFREGRSHPNPTVMTCLPSLFGRKLNSAIERSERSSELDEELVGIHVKLYTHKELRIATDDFSPSNKIGEGGFGSVYKGKLKNGQMAAIKVLSAQSRQGVREFLTEIQVISEIDHENLVKLYGCCVEDSHRILVYNYLENNSLAKTLLGEGNSTIQFNWRTRAKICIGVAQGLAYLHEEVRPHIVHRDIKASNILLDKDLTPKISDFGLAKLIPEDMTHVSTRVAGTIGYLAPEYAVRGQLTRKADIYSFGVLLMEVVSGRNNTNTRLPIEDQYLLERIWHLYERRELVVIVDTALNGNFDAEQACRFLKIGLLCTQDGPKLRPSMSTVVKMLTGKKDIDDKKITKPGLISDFMDLKVKGTAPAKRESIQTSYNYASSSGSDNLDATTFTSAPDSRSAASFTSPYIRSIN